MAADPEANRRLYPAKAELFDRLGRLRVDLLRRVERLSADDFARPAPPSPVLGRSAAWGDVLMYLAWHEGYHNGQLAVWRRDAGMARPLWNRSSLPRPGEVEPAVSPDQALPERGGDRAARALWDQPTVWYAAMMEAVTRSPSDDDREHAGTAGTLLPLVYEQLRAIAQERMKGERRGHTLQATALVHEAFLRLGGTVDPSERGTRYFFAAAGEAMRRILVEHARARARIKRGGAEDAKVPADGDALSQIEVGSTELAEADILRLDAALARLEHEDADAAQIVRLRFFAGLSGDEAARALGVSPSTVDRDWAFARARLFRLMQDAPPG